MRSDLVTIPWEEPSGFSKFHLIDEIGYMGKISTNAERFETGPLIPIDMIQCH